MGAITAPRILNFHTSPDLPRIFTQVKGGNCTGHAILLSSCSHLSSVNSGRVQACDSLIHGPMVNCVIDGPGFIQNVLSVLDFIKRALNEDQYLIAHQRLLVLN